MESTAAGYAREITGRLELVERDRFKRSRQAEDDFPKRRAAEHDATNEAIMNKSELIKALSEKREIHVDEAAKIVNAFVDSIKQSLVNGDRVEIRGFGSFKVKEYKGYVGRNPKTGDVVEVEPKRLPFFRPGKELKEFINS